MGVRQRAEGAKLYCQEPSIFSHSRRRQSEDGTTHGQTWNCAGPRFRHIINSYYLHRSRNTRSTTAGGIRKVTYERFPRLAVASFSTPG